MLVSTLRSDRHHTGDICATAIVTITVLMSAADVVVSSYNGEVIFIDVLDYNIASALPSTLSINSVPADTVGDWSVVFYNDTYVVRSPATSVLTLTQFRPDPIFKS